MQSSTEMFCANNLQSEKHENQVVFQDNMFRYKTGSTLMHFQEVYILEVRLNTDFACYFLYKL